MVSICWCAISESALSEVRNKRGIAVFRGSNISMTLKNCGELSTVPQFIYCFFAFYCNKDSWYVGHDTWLACQRSRVRFREETFFLARKNLRNLRTLTSESILEILAPMSKTTTFSRVFHPKNQQFSREIKVEFFGPKVKISNSVKKSRILFLKCDTFFDFKHVPGVPTSFGQEFSRKY